jgi:hypothetical protein
MDIINREIKYGKKYVDWKPLKPLLQLFSHLGENQSSTHASDGLTSIGMTGPAQTILLYHAPLAPAIQILSSHVDG